MAGNKARWYSSWEPLPPKKDHKRATIGNGEAQRDFEPRSDMNIVLKDDRFILAGRTIWRTHN